MRADHKRTVTNGCLRDAETHPVSHPDAGDVIAGSGGLRKVSGRRSDAASVVARA